MDLRALLLKTSTVMAKTVNKVSEIVAGEATGYSRITLSGVGVIEDDANELAEVVADHAVVTGLADQGVDLQVVFYDHNGADDTARDVIGWMDLPAGTRGNGQPLLLTWGAPTNPAETRGAILRTTF